MTNKGDSGRNFTCALPQISLRRSVASISNTPSFLLYPETNLPFRMNSRKMSGSKHPQCPHLCCVQSSLLTHMRDTLSRRQASKMHRLPVPASQQVWGYCFPDLCYWSWLILRNVRVTNSKPPPHLLKTAPAHTCIRHRTRRRLNMRGFFFFFFQPNFIVKCNYKTTLLCVEYV